MSKQQFLEQHLQPGEEYAGILLGQNGEPDQHVFLLPGDAEPATHAAQTKWAKSIGGRLPTRREQSLLIANLKPHFKPTWYWSGEKDAAAAGWAWCQYFDNGYQHYFDVYFKLRARAVRSVPIQ